MWLSPLLIFLSEPRQCVSLHEFVHLSCQIYLHPVVCKTSLLFLNICRIFNAVITILIVVILSLLPD